MDLDITYFEQYLILKKLYPTTDNKSIKDILLGELFQIDDVYYTCNNSRMFIVCNGEVYRYVESKKLYTSFYINKQFYKPDLILNVYTKLDLADIDTQKYVIEHI